MAVARLSNGVIERAEWDPKGPATQYLWDSLVTGLGVRLSRGGNKSFVIAYYRRSDGKRRFFTLARFGQLGVPQARTVARELLARVILGADPLGEKQAIRRGALSAPTLRDLVERYRKEIYPENGLNTRRGKECLWRLILAHFGEDTPIAKLGREPLLELFRQISKNSPTTANRAVPHLMGHALRLAAERWKTPDGKPWYPLGAAELKGFPLNPIRVRQRSFAEHEMRAIFAATWEFDSRRPAVMAMVRLLALTGARLGELSGAPTSARWTHYDPRHRVLLLPHSKADRLEQFGRRIYLPRAALPDIDRLYALRHSDWLIPGQQVGEYLPKGTLNDWWRRIVKHAGLGVVGADKPTLHIFRHTFQTTAASLRIQEYERGFLIGHRPGSARMTRKYTHLRHSHWLELADQVGAELARMAGLDENGQPLPEGEGGAPD